MSTESMGGHGGGRGGRWGSLELANQDKGPTVKISKQDIN